MTAYGEHYSVLCREILQYAQENFKNTADVLFADMTFGAGGHSVALAKTFDLGKVISVDQDPDALENGKRILREQEVENLELLNMNFEQFPQYCANKVRPDFVLMDLGVSSHHFDTNERGFSFQNDGPLNMRMDKRSGSDALTAKDILNKFSEKDIADIIYEFGEEHYSRKIAKRVVEQRREKPFETTKDFEEVCFLAYPKHKRHGKTHPATKSFQALRIYVNEELQVLENTLAKLFDTLKPGGALLVISFHSMEDRIVKHKFKEIFQNRPNEAKIETKKPILPSEKELKENRRSRSAKLRIIRKLASS